MEKINSLELLSEKFVTQGDLFTIDPYTSIESYNESLSALDNNNISYTEWISTLAPYKFYLNLGGTHPVMINYDIIDKTDWKFLVSKVQPLRTNDEVLLYRRSSRKNNIRVYINNDAFERAMKADKTLIFRYDNKEELLQLSNSYGLIYPLGKYINNNMKLAMCFDAQIKNVIPPNHVMLEIGKHRVGELEAQINWKVLRNQDKITKWVLTPKFKDGKFFPTSPKSPLRI